MRFRHSVRKRSLNYAPRATPSMAGWRLALAARSPESSAGNRLTGPEPNALD
jgi:hypothetical protein